MAKKREKKAKSGSILSFILDIFRNIFSLKDVVTNVKESFAEMLEKSIKKLIGAVLMMAGLIFLAVGFYYYLVDYLGMSKMATFLSIGVVLVLISYIIKYNAIKEAR